MEERQKQLEDETPRLQAEIDFLRVQYLSRDEVISEADDLYSRWADLTPEEKRKIVETITERIEAGKDEVAIHPAGPSAFRERLAAIPPSRDPCRTARRRSPGTSTRARHGDP